MFRVKKASFYIILILCFALGVCATVACLYFDFGISGLVSKINGWVPVSEALYNNYEHLAETYGKVEYIRGYVSENYYVSVDDEIVDDAILHSIVDSLGDKYSCYMNPDEYLESQSSMTGEYSGVGIVMQAKSDGTIRVKSTIKNSPAEKAGVKVNEIILKVDGTEYDAEHLSECAEAVRGMKGTSVTISFLSDGENVDRTLVRDDLIEETVEYSMLEDGIGYVYISSFKEATAEEFEDALRFFRESKANSFIIDLRDNPGGMVKQAVDIADMLMDKATIIYAEDQHGERSYYTTVNGRKCKLPFIVLVNENSASASEIFAAGIQDNSIAPIVGGVTFGKGIIQVMNPLKDGSAVKLTVLQYFSPRGNAIHEIGITPDYEVEISNYEYDEDGRLIVDEQLDKAIELLK